MLEQDRAEPAALVGVARRRTRPRPVRSAAVGAGALVAADGDDLVAEQGDERHPGVVVDDGEPLELARRHARVRPEVAQVARALGQPVVQGAPARRRRSGRIGRRCTTPPSEATTSASQCRGYGRRGRRRAPAGASPSARSVSRVVGVEPVQREHRPAGVDDRARRPGPRPRSTARGPRRTPSRHLRRQGAAGEPRSVRDPARPAPVGAGPGRGRARSRAGGSTTAAPPGTGRSPRRRGRASVPRRSAPPGRAARGRSRGARRRTAAGSPAGPRAWVSAPHWVTSSCGRNAASSDGTTAWKARSQPASAVPGGSATFTAVPVAGARAVLRRPARAREQRQRVLVQRDRQHPRVGVEGGLDAVAVVHVDVDVGDAVEPVVEQPGDRDRAVVVHAEPGRAVGASRGAGRRRCSPPVGPPLAISRAARSEPPETRLLASCIRGKIGLSSVPSPCRRSSPSSGRPERRPGTTTCAPARPRRPGGLRLEEVDPLQDARARGPAASSGRAGPG